MAASIAYHAFVSLLPLFLLVLATVSAVGPQGLETEVLALASAVFTEGARDVVITELRTAERSGELSLVGAALLVWGTLRIFRGLDVAFSDIYESAAANTTVDRFVDGLVVLVAVAGTLLAGAVIHRALPTGGGVGWTLIRFGALAVGLAVTLFPMYYLFPDADVGAVEVLPGVTLAVVGLTTAQQLFRLYIEVSTREPGQSVVAGVLVFLTWLYISGFVVLLGAAVNAVCANRSRDVSVDPLVGGVSRADAPDRDAVRTGLARLERAVDREARLDLVVDGERLTLPVPDRLVTHADGPGCDEVCCELQWTPQDR